jgi:hypothetical protein
MPENQSLKPYHWLLGNIKFRWVAMWWVLFAAALAVANMFRFGNSHSAAAQLKDSTDTAVNRWVIQGDPAGYVTGAILVIAVIATARWLVHFVYAMINGGASSQPSK